MRVCVWVYLYGQWCVLRFLLETICSILSARCWEKWLKAFCFLRLTLTWTNKRLCVMSLIWLWVIKHFFAETLMCWFWVLIWDLTLFIVYYLCIQNFWIQKHIWVQVFCVRDCGPVIGGVHALTFFKWYEMTMKTETPGGVSCEWDKKSW